jgi:hypothetical protein
MYETKKQKLAPVKVYYMRIGINLLLAGFILLICLAIGVIGYKISIPNFGWYNSLLNASMILSGMGPIIDPQYHLSNTAKVFASVYALFSGMAFLTTFGLIIAPVAHRFFHKIHLEDR